MSVRQELVSKFGPLANKDEVIKECEALLGIFSLTAEDLYVKWESYNVTKADSDLELNVANLKRLQEYIQSTLEKKATGSAVNANKNKRIVRPTISMSSSPAANFGIPSTPISAMKKRKLETPLSKVSSSARRPINSSPLAELSPSIDNLPLDTPSHSKIASDSGAVLETLNPQIDESDGFTNIDEDESTSYKPVKVVASFDAAKFKFRTMRQKLLEAADVLDDQIDSFAQIIQQHHNLPSSEFGNPCLASQFQIVAVGRIVPDSPLTPADATLNAQSLFLETSRLSGIGQRIPLNLSSLKDYSFFPGQIVALRGKNPTGEFFSASEILEIPYLGAAVSSEAELNEYNETQNGNGQKIVVCSGPYTTNKDLDFVNLKNLISKFNDIKPHAVILLGPFIDITHPKIIDGSVNIIPEDDTKPPKTLDEVFKKTIVPILKRINTRIQVIILPTTKDATSKHSAYPQDSFDRKGLGLPKNVRCFPNPSSFQLNEVSIGCSTNDIFKDLKDVTAGTFSVANRFERIAGHILEQRRYYPYFPGSIKTKKSDYNNVEHLSGSDLDVPYLGLTELNDILPDILIIPSELRYFVKVVKDVIFINPGTFMRPSMPGSYAVIHLSKPDISEGGFQQGEDGMYLNKVFNRARVDIIKT